MTEYHYHVCTPRFGWLLFVVYDALSADYWESLGFTVKTAVVVRP